MTVVAETDVPAPWGMAPEVSQLWAAWRASQSGDLRLALFKHYSPWARKVGRRLYSLYRYPLAEWHDYMHLASIGLLLALERYEPGRRVSFERFAYVRIKGEILNGLDEYRSESVRLPRQKNARVDTTLLHDKDPLVNIVNVAVGMALGQFLELGILSDIHEMETPAAHYFQHREAEHLQACVGLLPERERFVMESYYYSHLGFAEIATLLQVTAPRVSQLHRQALNRLRDALRVDGGL